MKRKKIEKKFTDQKKFDAFTQKHKVEMPKIEFPKFDILDGFKDSMEKLVDRELGMFFPKKQKALIKKNK